MTDEKSAADLRKAVEEGLEVTEEVTTEGTEVSAQSIASELGVSMRTVELAMEKGWKPESELPEGKEFVPPEVYLARGDFIKQQMKSDRELAQLRGDLDTIKKHYSTVEQATRAKVIAELKQAKVDALDEGDHAKVVQIDDQIAAQSIQPEAAPSVPLPEYTAFLERNKWFYDAQAGDFDGKDQEMTNYATMIGQGYSKLNPNASFAQVLEHVESETKARFSDKFKNQKREQPSSVEGTSPPKRKSKTFSEDDLSPEEKTVMKKFIRMGVSKEDYLNNVRATR